jgi:DNA-binding transcriptional MerR regulator
VVTTSSKRWKVGELAEATGLTVRTLHHYDEIGLLEPSARTESGHRLYDETDVQRLYRIVALRQIGLSLDEVKACFDEEGADPRPTLQRHLAELQRRIDLNESLKGRLEQILHALELAEEPTTADFLEALEVMERMEKYYTPEQLAQLEERRNELGDEGMAKAQQDWANLIAAVESARERGVDPADPEVQELGRKWHELIEAFTGGDPGIRDSLQKMYETEGPEKASRGMGSPEDFEYLNAIRAAGEQLSS